MTVSRNINAKKQTPVEQRCLNCGKVRKVWASTVRFGRGKYCSKACFMKSRERQLVCDFCGQAFTRFVSATSRYSDRNYCSRDCAYASRRKPDRVPIKRARYGSAEFLKARQNIIERDGVCQICGNSAARSVHHKNWRPYDNRLENLVLLCISCHGRFRREEDWESGRQRIMACSVLAGDRKSPAEMPGLDG